MIKKLKNQNLTNKTNNKTNNKTKNKNKNIKNKKINFEKKYLKYKIKYLDIKKRIERGDFTYKNYIYYSDSSDYSDTDSFDDTETKTEIKLPEIIKNKTKTIINKQIVKNHNKLPSIIKK